MLYVCISVYVCVRTGAVRACDRVLHGVSVPGAWCLVPGDRGAAAAACMGAAAATAVAAAPPHRRAASAGGRHRAAARLAGVLVVVLCPKNREQPREHVFLSK